MRYSFVLAHIYIAILLIIITAATAFVPSGDARANPVATDHAVASLVSEAEAIVPGQTFWVALRMELEEGWHVYWYNPGDSGLPPEIVWKAPKGFAIGEIHWPPPHVIPLDTLINYGYEDEVWLLIPVTPPQYINSSYTFILTADVGWLICKDICVPESAKLSLSLQVSDSGEIIPSVYATDIARQLQQLPSPLPQNGIYGGYKDKLLLTVTLPDDISAVEPLQSARFFPLAQGIISNQSTQTLKRSGNKIQLSTERGGLKLPQQLDGVLSLYGADESQRQDFTVTLELGEVKRQLESFDLQGLWQALLFALLGGIILNAMPCVFPILSLKALAIAKKAAHEPAQVKWQGLAYSAGVLLCFAILAGILIALQRGGEQIGWGFQLQSPLFVAAMAYLFFVVGLSLSGVFYFPTLFGDAMAKIGNGAGDSAGSGISGSFATGVLAALVATPCTAPFMAPAIGFALTQPPVAALGIFLALGAGLALPYLLISLFPPLLRLLPKPGAWMEIFKQFLAFPMYASAAWLLWVLTGQSGSAGLAYALAGIVLLAFAIWLVTHIRRDRAILRFLVIVLTIAALAATLYVQTPQGEGIEKSALQIDIEALKQPFSLHRLELLRSQQKAVFVNATADWCITCKANEKLALSSDRLWQFFRDRDITYLEADWTNRDADIANYLKSFGRDGVPLYVYYPPGNNSKPVILPQLLLGSGSVIEAIEAADGKNKQN